jgi:protein-tyrosine phosphatase
MHCHLLPGVDDGMQNLDSAVSAIRSMMSLGFSGAVLTPHIYHGVYDNETANLRLEFTAFTAAIAAARIGFTLFLAAEYFADDHFFALIEQDDILSMQVGAERWVLLELPLFQEAPIGGVCLAALVKRGYRPVIAHVERYRYVAREPARWLDRFAAAGAVLQGNIGSLAGQYGEEVKRFATWLAERAHIAVWATDIHQPEQIPLHIIPGLARCRSGGRLNAMLERLR